jgi:hypothetical protein
LKYSIQSILEKTIREDLSKEKLLESALIIRRSGESGCFNEKTIEAPQIGAPNFLKADSELFSFFVLLNSIEENCIIRTLKISFIGLAKYFKHMVVRMP